MGKITAAGYKKHLKESGAKNAWFGILDDVIAATKPHVEKIVPDIVLLDKRELVYMFISVQVIWLYFTKTIFFVITQSPACRR